MKRLLGLVVASTLLLFTLAASGGDSDRRGRHRYLLGLWEGVDVNDGSKRTVSITDRDRDGTFEVDSRDTYWTLCDGDRGLEMAVGDVRDDRVLETVGVVTCFGTDIEIDVIQTYVYSRREDTLLATPVGTGLAPVVLHRITAVR